MALFRSKLVCLAFALLGACDERSSAELPQPHEADAGTAPEEDVDIDGDGDQPDAGAAPVEDEPTPEAPEDDEPASEGPDARAATQRIGPAGGELRSRDGAVRLVVPAGALREERSISIRSIEDALPHQIGSLYQLEPEGVTFDRPVTLSFAYDPAALGNVQPGVLRPLYRDAEGRLHIVKDVTLDSAAHTVRVETRHFSAWSLVQGAQLFPNSARVNVGNALALQVVDCFEPQGGAGDVVLGNACTQESKLNAQVAMWYVNDQLIGSEEFGMVSPRGDGRSGSAIYSAPRAKKPSRNSVAVSVKLLADPVLGTQLLVSNIEVYDDLQTWTGTITYEASGSNSFQGSGGFVGSETHTYHASTTYTVTSVKERIGSRTTLTLRQLSDVTYEKDGSMRKEGYEICQAFGPVILRHLFEYSIASWLSGSVDTEVEGDVYIDDSDGSYSIGVDGQDIPLNGQDNIIDKYTHFCDGSVSDNSRIKDVHSVENSGDSFFKGVLDPKAPAALVGGYEKTLNDEYKTHIAVHWNLVHHE